LFRYAMAILKYVESVLMSSNSSSELNNVMRYVGDTLHDVDALAQVSCVLSTRMSPMT